MTPTAYLAGIGVLGPGLADWPHAAAVLTGRRPYGAAPTLLPAPLLLPAAERRRTGRLVRVALAVAAEAVAQSAAQAALLASVFTSSSGDGQNCHELCLSLAASPREVSPTRFTNSVHNAAAGYWSIAMGATAPCSVLCAHDASFTAGLIEALAQVTVEGEPVLLVAYDADYPPPLHQVRPVPDAFGVALLLTPVADAHSIAQLQVAVDERPASTLADAELEALRRAIPAARCLPLLSQLARRATGAVTLEYLAPLTVEVRVKPCP